MSCQVSGVAGAGTPTNSCIDLDGWPKCCFVWAGRRARTTKSFRYTSCSITKRSKQHASGGWKFPSAPTSQLQTHRHQEFHWSEEKCSKTCKSIVTLSSFCRLYPHSPSEFDSFLLFHTRPFQRRSLVATFSFFFFFVNPPHPKVNCTRAMFPWPLELRKT